MNIDCKATLFVCFSLATSVSSIASGQAASNSLASTVEQVSPAPSLIVNPSTTQSSCGYTETHIQRRELNSTRASSTRSFRWSA
jgi:hypothetical protein